MRPTARTIGMAVAFLAAALSFSGCVVAPDWWWDDRYPPRAAAFHVYVYDYWSTAPIPWAVVELYEEDWWSWDYRGSWPVGPSGYVTVPAGYLYADEYGAPEERDYMLRVCASGYLTESVEIELDYHHWWESVHFYLVPWGAGRGGAGSPDESAAEPPPDARPPDRVTIGQPKAASPARGD